MRSTFILKYAGAGTLLVGLLATHWIAFSLGKTAEHDRLVSVLDELMASGEDEALQHRLEAMKIMAKHPGAYHDGDLRNFCARTLLLAVSIEKERLNPARANHNDPVAERLQKEITEARRLSAILTHEKN
jgi:hypothetical protein